MVTLNKKDYLAIQRSLDKSNTQSPKNKVNTSKPRKRKGPDEDTIQEAVEEYLNLNHIRFIHIPKPVYALCGKFNIPQIVRNLISKYLRGVPDLLIFKKDGKYNSCLMIELKTDIGKVSQGQKAWHIGLSVEVCRSAEEAIELIKNWLNH